MDKINKHLSPYKKINKSLLNNIDFYTKEQFYKILEYKKYKQEQKNETIKYLNKQNEIINDISDIINDMVQQEIFNSNYYNFIEDLAKNLNSPNKLFITKKLISN
jgi:DNA repair protein RadC